MVFAARDGEGYVVRDNVFQVSVADAEVLCQEVPGQQSFVFCEVFAGELPGGYPEGHPISGGK